MLLIYLPQNSSRCQYVLNLIIRDELGIEFRATNDVKEFEEYTSGKISYSGRRIANEFFIKAAPFLFETKIKKQEIKVVEKDAIKFLFPNDGDDLGFDIFSSVFFMVSRYEEYLQFSADKFGRFKASDTLAFQNNFLQKPVVNIWVEILKKALQNKYPELKCKINSFNAIVTYDIDVAYKYKGRSFVRTIGSALKDIFGFRAQNFKERFQTLLQSKKDPWDIYEELQKQIVQNKLSSVFFFLMADKSEHDRNLNYQNPMMKKLVNDIKSFSEIGIHPSFHTSVFPEKILTEKQRLEMLSEKKIFKSRQHYLKFKFPGTFNSLFSSGILEDYSMGFPGMPGFRAGTCKPFYFYDLENEKATSLRIFPVTCMDATFIYYLEKSSEKSLVEILNLIKEIKNVNGTFIPIFHNDILGGNSKWKSVHDQMVRQIKSYLKSA